MGSAKNLHTIIKRRYLIFWTVLQDNFSDQIVIVRF